MRDYPFDFVQGDALEYVAANWQNFDAIHASPPCQAYTPMTNRHPSSQPELLEPVRRMLRGSGVPFVIENVRGAPLVNPIGLVGEMFGLTCHRPRLFELGGWYTFQPPIPKPQGDAVAVYGKPDGRRLFTRADGTELRAWSSVAEGRTALGIDWTENWHSIREAIPPAYTEWIGRAFLDQTS
jgi:DNA (cytosine-5)-methyltransferase 1